MGRGEEERAVATAGCGREAHVRRHSYVFITTRLSCGWQCAQWEGGRGGGGEERRRREGGESGEKVGKRKHSDLCVYSREELRCWGERVEGQALTWLLTSLRRASAIRNVFFRPESCTK